MSDRSFGWHVYMFFDFMGATESAISPSSLGKLSLGLLMNQLISTLFMDLRGATFLPQAFLFLLVPLMIQLQTRTAFIEILVRWLSPNDDGDISGITVL